MEVVNRWRASNFERRAVEDVLAEDVEWVVPKGGGVTTLRGIDAVLEWHGDNSVSEVHAIARTGPASFAPSSSLDPKANAVVDAIVVRRLSERFGTC
jgi:hypothetical protein